MSEDPRDDDQLPFLGDLGEQLKRAFRMREADDIGRALKRRRLMFLSPALALLLAGGAVAAVAVLKKRPSAPLSGPVAPSHSDSFPGSGTTRYSLVVTPDLGAGTVGWCINEQLQIPVPVPVGDISGIRALLLKERTRALEQRRSAVGNLAGQPGELYGPSGQPLFQTPPDTTADERDSSRLEIARVDGELPRFALLLRELRDPGTRASAAFQQAIRDIAGDGFQYTQPGTSCGHVERVGSAFIGAPYVGFVGGSYNILSDPRSPSTRRLTTTTVYLTAPDVAAVRTAPGVTILTRAVKALPDGYRIAISVVATQQKLKPGQKPLNNYRIYTAGRPINPFFGTLPSTNGAPTPIALDADGHALPARPYPAATGNIRVGWRPQYPGVREARITIPAGACEIRLSAVRENQPGGGTVVRNVRGFPDLAGRPLLSCAYTTWYDAHDNLVQTAILLDARHPGSPPPMLPDATPVIGHPGFINEPITQLRRSTNITARRIGNAWLVLETRDPLAQRIAILNELGACVHLSGAPCTGATETFSLRP
jgi:hypothetical protein